MGAAKENIGEAKWMIGGGKMGQEVVDGVMSPRKRDVVAESDALLVPRKRTNANRLITPRKALQPVQVNSLPGSAVAGQQVVLNDLGVADGEGADEKPVRRRKSMRKSRRLTRLEDLEGVPAAASEVAQTSGQDLQVFTGTEEVVSNNSVTQPEISMEEVLSNSPGQHAFQALLDDASTRQFEEVGTAPDKLFLALQVKTTEAIGAVDETDIPDKELEINSLLNEVAIDQIEGLEETDLTAETSDEVEHSATASDQPSSHPECASAVEEAADLLEDKIVVLEDADLEVKKAVVLDIDEENVGASLKAETIHHTASLKNVDLEIIEEQSPQTPAHTVKSTPILEAVNMRTRSSTSPTKAMATPRSKKKSPQPRPTRRSTRNTRSSSAAHEGFLASLQEAAAEPQATTPQLSTPFESAVQLLEASSDNPQQQSVLVSTDGAAVSSTGGEYQESNLSPVKMASAMEMEDDILPANVRNRSYGLDQTSEMMDITFAQEPENLATISNDEAQDSPPPTAVETPGVDMLDDDDALGDGQLLEKSESSNDSEFSAIEAGDDFTVQLPSMDIDSARQADTSEMNVAETEASELLEHTGNLEGQNLSDDEPNAALQESSTPDPSTTELTEAILDNAPITTYDHDDTDMLRSFLTRVKANKAAKAKTSIPKRKRSLPHSPLQIPLGTLDASSPSSPKEKDEFDVSRAQPSPSNRRKRNEPLGGHDNDATEPKSIRRSGRTRLPVKAAPLAPSCIPVRTRGQDDSTVTLRSSEDKERVALTKFNTRKNKGGASHPAEFLAKKADEKEDPVSRQRALKEVYDAKAIMQTHAKKKKTVVWAEELVEFQGEKKKVEADKGQENEMEVVKEVVSERKVLKVPEKIVNKERKEDKVAEKVEKVEEKKAVKVGMRSKMSLGMAVNGTPAPKRRVRK